MMTGQITESTAQRLVDAIERLTLAVERTQSIQAPSAERMSADVASLIIGGPEALKALNKRRRATGRKSQSKATGGRA